MKVIELLNQQARERGATEERIRAVAEQMEREFPDFVNREITAEELPRFLEKSTREAEINGYPHPKRN